MGKEGEHNGRLSPAESMADYAPSPNTCSAALTRANQLRVQALLRQLLVQHSEESSRRINTLRVLRRTLRELDYNLSWLTQVDFLETLERLLRDETGSLPMQQPGSGGAAEGGVAASDWRLANDATQLLIESIPQLRFDIDPPMIEQIFSSVIQNLGHSRSEVRRASLLLLNMYINEKPSKFQLILRLFLDYGLNNERHPQAQRGAILSLPLLITEQVVERENLLPLMQSLCDLLVEASAQLFYSLYLALQRLHLRMGEQRFGAHLRHCNPEATLLYRQAASRTNSLAGPQQQPVYPSLPSTSGSRKQQQQQQQQEEEQEQQVAAVASSPPAGSQRSDSSDSPASADEQHQQHSNSETAKQVTFEANSFHHHPVNRADSPGRAAEESPEAMSSSDEATLSASEGYFAADDEQDRDREPRDAQADLHGPQVNGHAPQIRTHQEGPPEGGRGKGGSGSGSGSSSLSSAAGLRRNSTSYAAAGFSKASSVSSTCSSQANLVDPAHYMTEAALSGRPLSGYEQIHHVDHSNTGLAIDDLSASCTPTVELGPASNHELRFGIFPRQLVAIALTGSARYLDRLEALQEMMCIIRESPLNHLAILLTYFDSFLEQFLARLLATGTDYKLELVAIDMIESIVIKTKASTINYVRPIIGLLVRALADSRAIFRDNTVRVIHKMMAFLPPQHVIDAIFEHKHNRSTLVREETINRVTAAILEYDKNEFNLTKLCYHILPMLADHQASVRLAALECIAALAQALGHERIGSLLTAAEAVQTGCDYDGLLDAIRARLSRRTLPRCLADGSIRFVIKPFLGAASAGQHHEQRAADVRWVLEAPSTHQHQHQHLESAHLEGGAHHAHRPGAYSPPLAAAATALAGGRRRSSVMPGLLGVGPEVGEGGETGAKHHHHHQRHQHNHHPEEESQVAQSQAPAEEPHLRRKSVAVDRLDSGRRVSGFEQPKGAAARSGSLGAEPRRAARSGSGGGGGGTNKGEVNSQQQRQQQEQQQEAQQQVALGEEIGRGPTEVNSVAARRRASRNSREQSKQVRGDAFKRSTSQDSLNGSSSSRGSSADTNKVLFQYYLGQFRQSLVLTDSKNGTTRSVLPSDSIIYSDPVQAYAQSKQQSRYQQTSFDYDTDSVGRVPDASVGPLKQKANHHHQEEQHKGNISISTNKQSSAENEHHNQSLGGGDDNNNTNKHSSSGGESPQTVMEASAASAKSASRRQDLRQTQRKSREDAEDAAKNTDKSPGSATETKPELRRGSERKATSVESAEGQASNYTGKRLPSDGELTIRRRRQSSSSSHPRALDSAQTRASLAQQEPASAQVTPVERNTMISKQESHGSEGNRRKSVAASVGPEADTSSRDAEGAESRRSSGRSGASQDGMARVKVDEQPVGGGRERRGRTLTRQSASQVADLEGSNLSATGSELGAAEVAGGMASDSSQSLAGGAQRQAGEATSRRRRMRRSSSHRSIKTTAARSGGQQEGGETEAEQELIEAQTGETGGGQVRRRASRSQPSSVARRSTRTPSRQQQAGELAPRAISVSPLSSSSVVPSQVNIRHILENVAKLEGPFQDPALAFKVATDALSSPCWSTKVEGVLALIRLVAHHQPIVLNHLHELIGRTVAETRNLRSTVARSAIFALGDFCARLGRQIEPELDTIVQALLSKSTESTAFIRDDIRLALSSMLDHLTHWRLANSLIQHGSSHKSGQVRRMASQFVAQLVERMGAAKCLVGARDISAQLIPAAAKFAQDSSPHTRYFGRVILAKIMQHNAFDRLMRKNLTPNLYRSTLGVIESVKRRGPGEPPVEGLTKG